MQYKITSYWEGLYEKEFILDRVTVIGRFPQELNNSQIAWLSREEINPEGRIPHQLIRIIHPDVSRNHVLIYSHGNQLKLRDLKSTNGTYVNSFRTEIGILKQRGYFSLGSIGGPGFRVGYDLSDKATNTLTSSAPTKYFALLVGYNDGNLKGVDNDIYGMQRVLAGRKGFGNRIELLRQEKANVRNIRNKIKEAGDRMKEGDAFLFYFAGHGNERLGRSVLSTEVLPPAELYFYLNSLLPVESKEIVIVDGCFSGHFASETYMRPEMIVLTSTTEKEPAKEAAHNGEVHGIFTASLIDIIEQESHRLNWRELKLRLENHHLLRRKGQKPMVAACDIKDDMAIPSRNINLPEE